MVLLSNTGQRLLRPPPSAAPRECVNTDNLNGTVHAGTGPGGNVTDQHWAQQAATAAMRGNLVKLLFKVPWQPHSWMNTGWVTIPRVESGHGPDAARPDVCKYDGQTNSPLASFEVGEQGWLALKQDILALLRHPAFSRLMFSDVLGGREYTSIQPFSIYYTAPVAPRLREAPDWKTSCKLENKSGCLVTNG